MDKRRKNKIIFEMEDSKLIMDGLVACFKNSLNANIKKGVGSTFVMTIKFNIDDIVKLIKLLEPYGVITYMGGFRFIRNEEEES